jgi:hypothetical protein
MKLIPEQELPLTRLELRWRKVDPTDNEGYNALCEYNLVLELDPLDIRGEKYDEYTLMFRSRAKVVPLGGTRTNWNGILNPERTEIRTPFRDSAHIKWDSKRLGNLPMFAVADGLAMQLPPAEDDS